MSITTAEVRSILTRTTGFLKTVSSHSLQPYRGCSFGNSLCGVGCYVQHNHWLTRGEPWGSFLEARTNATGAYLAQVQTEARWARKSRGSFSVFLSSSTDPFVPQETRFRVTERLLETMIEHPPDALIIQTHSHRVTDYLQLYPELARVCELRFHVSIESDRDRLPGLPPPASSVERRFDAAAALHDAGLRVVITVSPLLPIARPVEFFERIARVGDAVVVDHYVGGDGSADGIRTRATHLPGAMEEAEPGSSDLRYRDRIVDIARRILPGRVGVSIDGFAGRFLPAEPDHGME
jgi:DNA repair photolyase